MYQRSLTLRLTCFFAIVSMIVLTGLGLLIYLVIDQHFIEQDQDIIADKALVVKRAILSDVSDGKLSTLHNQLEGIFEEHHILVTNIKRATEVIYSSSNVNFPSDNFKYKKTATTPLVEWLDNDDLYRGVRFKIASKSSHYSELDVLIAININHHRRFLNGFKVTLIKFILIAGSLSGILGWFATRQGLSPLKRMKEHASSISVNHLDQRMPVDSLPIEIADLSLTLNNMLKRLEDDFKRLSHFSTDIAHELRTPISNLMTQTQVSLSQSRTAKDYQLILASNSEEFERLSRMISDMLYLAKSENNFLLTSPEFLHLEEEINDLFEFYDALAEEKKITLRLHGKAQIHGDKIMIRRAFSNLISNALRHSQYGRDIVVRISSLKGTVTVVVENNGVTIPSDDLPYLFERFYRADKSRTHHSSEGVGLGLAITQSIIFAHGGHVTVNSENGVTKFTLTLKGRC